MSGNESAAPTRTTFTAAWLRTAIGTLTALGMSLPSRDARARVIRLAREFGYDHRTGPAPSLPTREVNDVMGDVPIALREPVSADGNVSLLELAILNSLVAARHPRGIFEIGTFDGRTTLNFAANAPEAAVNTLDLPSSSTPALEVHSDDRPFIRASQEGVRGRRFHGTSEAARIAQLEGDSATFDYSPYVGAMDFVFVDGAHSYDYVLADSRTAMRLAAPHALIVWHDYGQWEGVTRALNELRASHTAFSDLVHVRHTTLALLEV